MRLRVRLMRFMGMVLLAAISASCGSGSSSSNPASGGSSAGSGSAGLTDQERTQAAETTAGSNALCTSLTPFYWEIGDKDGALASGTGGDNSGTPPNSTSLMAIASASKWVFSSYALEKLDISASNPLSATQVQYLNFTSGYVNMNDATCFLASTVGTCFSASNLAGGTNGDQTAADEGHFFYNGGHMQAMAVNVFGLGGDYINVGTSTPKLNTEIMSGIGQGATLYYSNPSLAGGVVTTAGDYATFLRAILTGDLRMKDYLSADVVCAHANSSGCPSAIYSPINQSAPGTKNNISDEAWHYSLGHWIEDDPNAGDGSFSSPGADGFYPWIDSSVTYYGILARFDSDPTALPGQEPYVTSVHCGRAIRKAWLTGQPQ